MTTILERARENADRMVEDAMRLRQRQAGGASPVQSLTAGHTSSFGFGGDQSAQKAKTQYDRNTSWTYAAVRPIANRVAAQPVHVARVTRVGNERAMGSQDLKRVPPHVRSYVSKTFHLPSSASLEILESHPFLDALHDPNGVMTRYSLMFLLAASLQLAGRSFWWVTKSGRRDGLDIWSLPAHWVTADHSGGFRASWKVKPPETMQSVDVPGETMGFFNYPKVSDPFGSYAPVEAGARDILTDEAIKEAQHRSFENGFIPGMAIVLGETAIGLDGNPARPRAESHQIQQLDEYLNQFYSGSRNSRRFILLDALIKDVHKISTNPDEMDFQDSGRMVKKAIMQIFGVNEIIAGEIEGANRASAVVADENFLSNVVNPLLSLITQTINRTILPLFRRGEEQIVAWVEEGTATDPAERRADWELGFRMRAVTRDQYLTEVLGMPPMPNGVGQSFVMGFNEIIQPVGEVHAVLPAPEDDEGDEERRFKGNGRDRHVGNGKNQSRLIQVRYHDVFLKLHGRGEDSLADDLRGFFRAQEKDILSRLRDANGPAPAESLFNPGEWDQRLKDAVSPHLFRAALSGALLEREMFGANTVAAIAALQVKREVPTPEQQALIDEILIDLPDTVQAGIRDAVAETLGQPYWSEMNGTTLSRLDGAIQQSLVEGLNLQEMAKLVGDSLGVEASSVRAIATARTETTSALNAGSFSVRQELASEGLVTGQEWLTTLDSDTRRIPRDTFDHVAMSGQRVGASDNFDVSGEPAPYPAHHSLSAGNRINCRCSAISVTIASELSFSGRQVRRILA